MVRGISKQVVVVEGNSGDFYENAFFILKENSAEGVGEKELLNQAKSVLADMGTIKIGRWKDLLWAIGGFVLSSGIWLTIILL